MIVWLRQRILRAVHPVLTYLASKGAERLVTKEFVDEVVMKIQPGDVLVSKEDRKLINYLIPGNWSHAAMYIGKGIVIEAKNSGVTTMPLIKWLYEKDHVAVLRPKFATPEQAEMACIHVKSLEGDPYDYAFTGDNRAWYCAEIIWYAYDSVFQPSPFTKRETWGVPTATPQDFYAATNKFDLISKFNAV